MLVLARKKQQSVVVGGASSVEQSSRSRCSKYAVARCAWDLRPTKRWPSTATKFGNEFALRTRLPGQSDTQDNRTNGPSHGVSLGAGR